MPSSSRLFRFTGNCPVRQHAGDGTYVGRCDHSTYADRCPLHGDVGRWLASDFEADLRYADDRYLPPLHERDFGSRKLRKFLAVSP